MNVANSHDDIVESIGNMADSITQYKQGLLQYLKRSTTINPDSKLIMEHMLNGSFEAISQLYKYVAFDMRMIDDLKRSINKLPNTKEFDEIKNTVNQTVRTQEKERQFVQNAKRYFDDMSKEVNSSGDSI